MMNDDLDVAVLIPCYNEAVAIPAVISAFRRYVPAARIYVYDNNSTDGTAQVAVRHGAIVRLELQQGKGHVVRRMFSDIDASVYILVDGDDTYSAESAPLMIETLQNSHCDMVNGRRVSNSQKAYRFGHQFGNRLLTSMVAWLFGKRSFDMLSGYRVFSRRFVKSFPALSTGFEIETELTIHALSLNMPIAEIPTPYKDRPEKSVSKLNTYRDGMRILWTILLITKEERPFFFFSIVSAVLAALALGMGVPIVLEWLRTGLVPRFPTAILSASVMLLAFLSLSNGMILSSVARGRREVKRLHYLNQPWLDRRYRAGSPPAP
jgi:glycosyltransferase involved in cell wall biosynthesis